MRTFTTAVAAALATVVLGPQETAAQAPNDVPTVAVMDFSGFMLGEAGNSVAIGKAVSAMLVTEFSGRDVRGSSPLGSTFDIIPFLCYLKKNDKTEGLLDVVVWVADEFSKKLDLTSPSSRPAVEPIPVKATIEFSRAVDFEDKGDTAKAIEHYEEALEVYPAHRDAQRALDRLRGGEV